jgi:NADPH:quinone reductase-like Zn-dependent oxidoreductase
MNANALSQGPSGTDEILDLPPTMKAAISRGFGSIDDNVFVIDDWPVPDVNKALEVEKKKCRGGDDRWLLIRVLACALAPGDVRILKGSCDYAQMPPTGHPYVIGSDSSGIVVVSDACGSSKFRNGDYVVSRFDGIHPVDGAAQYRWVQERLTERCPASIPPVVAAGLPASALVAKRIVREYVRPRSRVLILGGSGGVGTSVIQYARRAVRQEGEGTGESHEGEGKHRTTAAIATPKAPGKAGSVIAVSTQRDLCLSLGVDRVIDYRTHNWWQDPELISSPVDVVIDLVNGPDNWPRGGRAGPGTAIRRGGTYVALLVGVQTEIEVHSAWDVVRTVAWVLGRTLWTRLNPLRLPSWTVPNALQLDEGDLTALFQDVVDGNLRPVLDPLSPFDFTEQGVRDAMRLQQSGHAHGKVVIKIADL